MLGRNAVLGAALGSLLACAGERSPSDADCLDRVHADYIKNDLRDGTAIMMVVGTDDPADDGDERTVVSRSDDDFTVELGFESLDNTNIDDYRALFVSNCGTSNGLKSGDFDLRSRGFDSVIGATVLEAGTCGTSDVDGSIYLTNYRDRLSDCDTAYGVWDIDSWWDADAGRFLHSIIQYDVYGDETFRNY